MSNDDDKTSAFGNYFSSVFTVNDSTANNVDDQDNVIIETDLEISLSEIEFSDQCIFKALDNLNIYKSPGPDGLHPGILFETRNAISTPLRIIFETALRMKQLPKDWIDANISAIYKKGNKSDLSNYRPVSLTSIPCKVMEGFIRDYILKHIIDNHLFNNNQYGFLKG